MSILMLIAMDDLKVEKKIELTEPYQNKITLQEAKGKKVCIQENIKLNIGTGQVYKHVDKNMELIMESPKDEVYQVENCYTASPK